MLAFDTATPAVTVALHDGAATLAESTTVDARRHGELLAPAIDEVLAHAGRRAVDITDIAVGVGPGPFTGLRVGVVTARALGDALGVPVHGVCTLDVLAHGATRQGLAVPFAVATDARRREVYWARYTATGTRLTEPAVGWPASVAEELAGLPVVGAGASIYPEAFPDAREPRLPAGSWLAELTCAMLAEDRATLPPEPLYLRRPDAVEPGARKPVLAGGTRTGGA